MARTPTKTERIIDPSGGSNQTRVRAHNERLVLTLVRRHGQLAKSEIARRTGLSPQTVSVIMRSLEADGLLLRGQPIRGKVGQPSIPMGLNPDGVYSFGLKVGRRSAELILVDFVGTKRQIIRTTYDYPLPMDLLQFAQSGIEEMSINIAKKDHGKIAGVGIAIPFQLWNWAEKVGAPKGTMDAWIGFDFAQALEERTGLTAFTQNDATAACGAELTFGRGAEFSDYVYFFVGTFIGGGIVLNHSVYSGRTGNAGALGPLPIREKDGTTSQLLDYASIYALEELLTDEGKDQTFLRQTSNDWSQLGPALDHWLDHLAQNLAVAVVAATSIIDFEAAIIDGAIPAPIRTLLVKKIKAEAEKLDLQGIALPTILEGTIGSEARALGGASLPLFNRYLLDQNVLFKALG